MHGILHMFSFNYTNGHRCCLLSLELTMKMDAQEMAMYTMHVAIHVIALSAPNACVELIPLSSTPRDLALQH